MPEHIALPVPAPQQSFQTLKDWVKELEMFGPPNIIIAVAGNKVCVCVCMHYVAWPARHVLCVEHASSSVRVPTCVAGGFAGETTGM